MNRKFILAIMLIMVAFLFSGFAFGQLQHGNQTTDEYLLTEVARLDARVTRLEGTPGHVLPSPTPHTYTPSPPPTWTRTPSATYGMPVTPTQEVPGTHTSTPAQTQDPFFTCTPDADFLAFSTVRRRSSHQILPDNIYANAVTKDRTENVCLNTLLIDNAGYTWIQIAASRPEWVAISRFVNGNTEYYGTLVQWGGATPTPTPSPTTAPQPALYPFTIEGNRIYLNGEPFKFVGVNFRELIGYDNRIMPYAGPHDVTVQLDGAGSLGMRVVRFYVSHKSLTVDQAIPRVRNILDMLEARGMYAILVISDGAYSGFEVKDNSQNRAVNGIDRYTHRFFEGGYRDNYLPYVETLTKAIGSHPAIFAWEPINEATTVQVPPTQAQMDAFIAFYADVTAVIRRNSPGKMVSSGLESCYQLFVLHAYENGEYCARLYQIVDIGTIHTYQENTGQPLGSSWMHFVREMQLSDQPLIVEEINTAWEVESTDWLAGLVKAAFSRLSGILQWNMSFPYARDIGVGDGAWNAPAGTAQSRRWFHITGFWRSLADQLRLQY